MQDVMVDLETLGDTPGSAILSIGAVAFDPETGEIDDGFYTVINVNSCVVAGLTFTQGTLDWWKKQSPEARGVLKAAYADTAPSLHTALIALNAYLARFGGLRNCKVWGNGASFDNSMLTLAYKGAGAPLGWQFWNDRGYRTLKNEWPQVPLGVRVGVFHNALDDAKTQAAHALEIYAFKRRVLAAFATQGQVAEIVGKIDAVLTRIEAEVEEDLVG
jgi:hypothetical protein